MTENKPNALKPLEHSIFVRVAKFILALWERAQQVWVRWAALNQHAAWFPFMLAAVVGFDSMVVILPGDVVVALAVLSNPPKWKRLAVFSAIGSALGAFVLYLVLHYYGKAALDQLTAQGLEQPHWQWARHFFKKWGLYSLAIGSLLPGMGWPPVVMAGLSTDNWPAVLALLFVGRLARYLLLSFGMREGWAMFQTLREQAKEKKEAKSHRPN